MEEKFHENLEDREIYINIKWSKIHRIAYRLLLIPCAESIEWILSQMDNTNLVLSSESGINIMTYHSHDMLSYYNVIRLNEYANTEFYAT